jgi:23S rRNA G2445 N2-methylase RlmL
MMTNIDFAKGFEFSDNTLMMDPMCGSGTLGIEAALMALDVPVGLLRFKDGRLPHPVSRWPVTEELKDVWNEVLSAAVKRDRRNSLSWPFPRTKRILLNDFHPGSIELAKKAARAAGVYDMIDFTCQDISNHSNIQFSSVLITNPPWGIRLSESNDAWAALGELFRKKKKINSNSKLWTLTGNLVCKYHLYTRLRLSKVMCS